MYVQKCRKASFHEMLSFRLYGQQVNLHLTGNKSLQNNPVEKAKSQGIDQNGSFTSNQ